MSAGRKAQPKSTRPNSPDTCSLAEVKAPAASVSLERARELIEFALRKKVEVREQEALSAARSRIEADLGPRLDARRENELLSLAGVAKILRDLDVPPEIIDECLAGELNAVKLQDDIAAKKVSLGLAADTPQAIFAAEMSLSKAVDKFLSSFDSKLEAAKMNPHGEYFKARELRIELFHVPFEEWRLRWTRCPNPIVLLQTLMDWIPSFRSSSAANSIWNVFYCDPILRSTTSPALQRLIDGIEERGCEVVYDWKPDKIPPYLDIGFQIRQKGG